VWAGTWHNGRRGFCIDFGKTTPNQKGSSLSTGTISGMSAEETKQAKYIANKYDDNQSNQSAANAGLAIWRLERDANFVTWYKASRHSGVITARREQDINAILADAAQHAPYKMTVVTDKVQVGQTGKGTVQVLGSNGKPAANREVTVTSGQSKILKGAKGNTGSNGLLGFTYLRTHTGKVTFNATLITDSSSRARVSLSQAGHQRTLSGVDTEKKVASWDYKLTVEGAQISSSCPSDCDGKPTVTFKFTNHSGTQSIKWVEKVDGKVVAILSAKPGAPGTAKAELKDGDIIDGSSYCYTGSVLGGSCTTSWVIVPVHYEIVCPAWASGELTLPCNCTPNLKGKVTLTSPSGSRRFYTGFVSINNKVAYQGNLVGGQNATISTGPAAAGTTVVVSFTAYQDAAHTIPLASHVLQDVTIN